MFSVFKTSALAAMVTAASFVAAPQEASAGGGIGVYSPSFSLRVGDPYLGRYGGYGLGYSSYRSFYPSYRAGFSYGYGSRYPVSPYRGYGLSPVRSFYGPGYGSYGRYPRYCR